MTDVMIDFETFGNGKDACLCQIGACYFDRKTGAIGATMKINVDARTSQRSGAALDADTVYWWLQQSPAAIASIVEGPHVHIDDAIAQLNHFLAGAEAIWSHATFDFSILQETVKRLAIKPEFKYKAARDIRTLNDLAGIPKDQWPKREGVHHDALADAIFQAGYVTMMLKKLSHERDQSQMYDGLKL